MSHQLLLASPGSNFTELAAWWILAIVAVGAALGMIFTRRAVHCAVLLAVVMLILAAMYAMQGAPFLAFVQVIVYTGAVLMLFLFVMMIVGISSADSIIETIRGQRFWAALAGIALLILLVVAVGHAAIGPAAPSGPRNSSANVTDLAALIFTKYVFPFEVTSALLITAALGAMVLAHRERTGPKPTQRMLSRQRIASGRPAPLPGPGTYARHNAVDMPALLPDGSTSRLSVSGVLASREAGRQGVATAELLEPGEPVQIIEAGPDEDADDQPADLDELDEEKL
ncbi:MAG TPA: NADH-quinone oxidoreductase subunit J [Streptosporangiaceae bacterium]|nr:NADH-quinone oxidoreductase subunit J [Streptosporangiaceae bacterium]